MSVTGPAIVIRAEAPDDADAIRAVTQAAFEGMPFSRSEEPHIIDRLREAGDLALSLVAANAERIVGHIAFSPVTISDGSAHWFGLGPISVWPQMQRRGIGTALIKHGIAGLREQGANGIVVLGSDEPYARFGFVHNPGLVYSGAPAQYFQSLVLAGSCPRGEVKYAPAFD
jgi:putative acetyltransferase